MPAVRGFCCRWFRGMNEKALSLCSDGVYNFSSSSLLGAKIELPAQPRRFNYFISDRACCLSFRSNLIARLLRQIQDLYSSLAELGSSNSTAFIEESRRFAGRVAISILPVCISNRRNHCERSDPQPRNLGQTKRAEIASPPFVSTALTLLL